MAKKTQLHRVELSGEFRGQAAVATFERKGNEWHLLVEVGKESRLSVLAGDCKPCWTIALEYLADACTDKPKPKVRKREATRPALKLYEAS